jgi:hypothetical protein
MFWMGKLLQQECVVRGVYFVPSRRTLSQRGEKVDESPSGALDLVKSEGIGVCRQCTTVRDAEDIPGL